jgi:hypothetical protein
VGIHCCLFFSLSQLGCFVGKVEEMKEEKVKLEGD